MSCVGCSIVYNHVDPVVRNDRHTGAQVGEELVRTNCALVVYEPGPGMAVIDVG